MVNKLKKTFSFFHFCWLLVWHWFQRWIASTLLMLFNYSSISGCCSTCGELRKHHISINMFSFSEQTKLLAWLRPIDRDWDFGSLPTNLAGIGWSAGLFHVCFPKKELIKPLWMPLSKGTSQPLPTTIGIDIILQSPYFNTCCISSSS